MVFVAGRRRSRFAKFYCRVCLTKMTFMDDIRKPSLPAFRVSMKHYRAVVVCK
jgi:hypothetical protein